ncbi:hypothetical protein NPIL_252111, partial [Nephila pilipes]
RGAHVQGDHVLCGGRLQKGGSRIATRMPRNSIPRSIWEVNFPPAYARFE